MTTAPAAPECPRYAFLASLLALETCRARGEAERRLSETSIAALAAAGIGREEVATGEDERQRTAAANASASRVLSTSARRSPPRRAMATPQRK